MKKMAKFSIFHIAFAMFLLTIFVMGSFAVMADNGSSESSSSAGDSQNTSHEQEGVSQSLESEQQRSVQFQVDNSTHEIHVSSHLDTGNNQNEIQFNLNAEHMIHMEFQYQGSNGTNQTNLQISIELRKLVEFIDNTTNPNNTLGGLDSADKIVNTIDFRNVNWSLASSSTNVSGQMIYSATVSGQVNGTTIKFVFHFATSFVYLNNKTFLQPTAAKFDIIIQNYQYSSPNSQLSLEASLQSQLKSRTVSQDTQDEQYNLTKTKESGINFGGSQYGGFFSWTDNILVDGQNKTVITSPVTQSTEDASYNTVYFSFPQGTNLTWDPKIGVDYNTTGITFGPTSSTPGFDFVPVVVLFPLLGLVSITISRRRRNNK